MMVANQVHMVASKRVVGGQYKGAQMFMSQSSASGTSDAIERDRLGNLNRAADIRPAVQGVSEQCG